MLSGIEENIHLNHNRSDNIITIYQEPVMPCALDVLTRLVKDKTVTLYAKGESIPTAVAVANVIRENMLKGNCKIIDITVDSESPDGNALVSIIRITITKTN